jgi:2-polyprenyl-3-methyl-5-hydroxy-6-metoxy-1,4-benzoquinol methylase
MKWHDVDNLMNLQVKSAIDKEKNAEDLLFKLQVFDKAFHNLEACQVESGQIIKDQNFDFVPFPCGAFVDLLIEGFCFLGKDSSKKFLDVGCGIGSKVILACSLFDAYGIDYDQKCYSL